MKRRCRLLITWLSIGIFLAILLVGLSTLPPLPSKTCDWCHEPFTEKITQVREYTLCPYCWTKLSYKAGTIWGNLEDGYAEEWHSERMQWIYDKIKERTYEKD